VYAPQGDVTLNGNGDFMGSIMARDITLSGNTAFHYDASLGTLGTHAPLGVQGWRVITSPTERQLLAPHFSGW